uniref:Uncharacterized protein n=1 Tax=Romanomermis culicivorax TaxID=13658 RepID=A0A915KSR4_ROMCU
MQCDRFSFHQTVINLDREKEVECTNECKSPQLCNKCQTPTLDHEHWGKAKNITISTIFSKSYIHPYQSYLVDVLCEPFSKKSSNQENLNH